MNEKEFQNDHLDPQPDRFGFAAIACAFITIGVSVAPAVAPVAPYLA
jgi:hypothetical protein